MNLFKINNSSNSLLFIFPIFVILLFFGKYFYDNAIETKKIEIQEKTELISAMIESVASFDAKYSNESDFHNDSTLATLSQVRNTFSSMDVSMEYLLASIKDDTIIFEAYSKEKPPSVKLSDTNLAVPMRNALKGLRGVIIELDYDGKKVFAAYTKVKGTHWGLVVKQPYSEYIEPIILQGTYIAVILILLLIGLFLYMRKEKLYHNDIKIANKRLKELNQNLMQLSITDGLTGIYNRRHFNSLFPEVINSRKNSNELIALMIMDIDYFKQYNDTYGHKEGDNVLINVANSIKGSIDGSDSYCFRIGGEEFAVIFKTNSIQEAKNLANKTRKNIEELSIDHSGSSTSKYVTVSIGLTCKNANEIDSVDKIFKETDDLLYKAKESGRNRVCL
jgi:diguanylate cyclase (GGDEF)-like protein